jgi:nitronate monooxygenase
VPERVLGHALAGDVRKGLFFRGAGRLPFGTQIRPVRDLLDWLVGHPLPANEPEALPA